MEQQPRKYKTKTEIAESKPGLPPGSYWHYDWQVKEWILAKVPAERNEKPQTSRAAS